MKKQVFVFYRYRSQGGIEYMASNRPNFVNATPSLANAWKFIGTEKEAQQIAETQNCISSVYSSY